MGMFDYIKCEYELPIPGANELPGYQSKCTPSQQLDLYTIKADGTLWETCYDRETKSFLPEKFLSDFSEAINFYTNYGPDEAFWIEFEAYFVNGRITKIEIVSA